MSKDIKTFWKFSWQELRRNYWRWYKKNIPMSGYDIREVGTRIKDLRTEQGMTQQKLANELCCTPQNVSLIECGKVIDMSVDMLVRVSNVFKVSINYILYGENHVETDSEKTDIKMQIERLEGIRKEVNTILEQLYRKLQV